MPPPETVEWTRERKSLSLVRLLSRMVVPYVLSVMSRSGLHLSIQADPRCLSGVVRERERER